MNLLLAMSLPSNFWIGAYGGLIFGVLGIFLLILGYFAFDYLTPKLDIPEQLNKNNISVGIVVAALLIGISIIVSKVVH